MFAYNSLSYWVTNNNSRTCFKKAPRNAKGNYKGSPPGPPRAGGLILKIYPKKVCGEPDASCVTEDQRGRPNGRALLARSRLLEDGLSSDFSLNIYGS